MCHIFLRWEEILNIFHFIKNLLRYFEIARKIYESAINSIIWFNIIFYHFIK